MILNDIHIISGTEAIMVPIDIHEFEYTLDLLEVKLRQMDEVIEIAMPTESNLTPILFDNSTYNKIRKRVYDCTYDKQFP